jgi:hypothetical protein
MKTFNEMIKQLDSEYKEKYSKSDTPAEVWVSPWSEGVIEVFRSGIKYNTENLYWKVFNLVSSLPKTLKKEWLKNEILELNVKIYNEIDAGFPTEDFDILEDFLIVQFSEYNLERYSVSDSDHSEIYCLLEENTEPYVSVYGSSYSIFDYYEKMMLTKEQGKAIWLVMTEDEHVLKLWPQFDQITRQLAILCHYRNIVASYEEIERLSA